MSKAKHTPGPWMVDVSQMDNDALIVNDGYAIGSVFDAVPDCEHYTNEQHANARLIAAAPDLLAALERLEEYVGAYVDVDDLGAEYLQTARAAIAKATGEG